MNEKSPFEFIFIPGGITSTHNGKENSCSPLHAGCPFKTFRTGLHCILEQISPICLPFTVMFFISPPKSWLRAILSRQSTDLLKFWGAASNADLMVVLLQSAYNCSEIHPLDPLFDIAI